MLIKTCISGKCQIGIKVHYCEAFRDVVQFQSKVHNCILVCRGNLEQTPCRKNTVLQGSYLIRGHRHFSGVPDQPVLTTNGTNLNVSESQCSSRLRLCCLHNSHNPHCSGNDNGSCTKDDSKTPYCVINSKMGKNK